MKQKDQFLNGGGNKWFERNEKVLNEKDSFIDMDEILPFFKKESVILEVGCSNGVKLNYLREHVGLKANLSSFHGIDPSQTAIDQGNEKFPWLNLQVGTSDHLDYPENHFDIVILGFCLYLVDRNLIFKTMAEVDRVLRPGGYLIITDFDVPYPSRRKFIHNEGVYSYKNNYSNFFTGGGHYTIVRKIQFSHNQNQFDPEMDERISTAVLYKELIETIYQERA